MLILLLSSSLRKQTFLGTYISNNNTLFKQNNDIDRAVLINTMNQTIQILIYETNYLDSNFVILCGNMFNWSDQNRLQADLSMNICKQSQTEELEQYAISILAGANWPTVEQRRFSESHVNSQNNCNFRFYANLEDINESSLVYDKQHTVIQSQKNLQGMLISKSCRISVVITAQPFRPAHNKYLFITLYLLQLVNIICGPAVKVYAQNTEYDNIMFAQSQLKKIALLNLDFMIQFANTIFIIVIFGYVALREISFLKNYILLSAISVIDLVIVQRFLSSQGIQGIAEQQGIQIKQLRIQYYQLIVLGICVIGNTIILVFLPAHCVLTLIILAIIKNIIKVVKCFFIDKKIFQNSFIYIIICYINNLINDLILCLAVCLVQSSFNVLNFQPINYSLVISFCILMLLQAIFITIQLIFCFLKTKKQTHKRQNIQYYPYYFLKELIPHQFQSNLSYIAVPYMRNKIQTSEQQCHNPYHDHSEYYQMTEFFIFRNMALPSKSQCFLIISENQLNQVPCSICLESLDLYSKNGFYFDLQDDSSSSSQIESADIVPAYLQIYSDGFQEDQPQIYDYTQNDLQFDDFKSQGLEDFQFQLPRFDQLDQNLPEFPQMMNFPLQNNLFFESIPKEKEMYPILDNKIILNNVQKKIVNTLYVTNCAHIFHKTCIQQWINAGNDCCPIDRVKLIQ